MSLLCDLLWLALTFKTFLKENRFETILAWISSLKKKLLENYVYICFVNIILTSFSRKRKRRILKIKKEPQS